MYWQDFEEMEFDAISMLKGLVKGFGESVILDPGIDTNYLLLK